MTVQCLRMGGAFGGKEVQANPWAAIAALGAWKTQAAGARAVAACAGYGAHRQAASVPRAVSRRAFAKMGASKACGSRLYSDGGWSLDLSEPGDLARDVPLR